MADQSSSTAANKSKKKGGGIVKRFRDLIKRPETANDSDSARQLISTGASVSSTFGFGAHDLVQENDVGGAASSKYLYWLTILVLSMTNLAYHLDLSSVVEQGKLRYA